jgi:hypothetical protein
MMAAARSIRLWIASAIRLMLPVIIPATSLRRISKELERTDVKAALDFMVNFIFLSFYTTP